MGLLKQEDVNTVLQNLARDYLEVLATARSSRIERGKHCIVSLIRKYFSASAGEPYYQDPGNVYVVILEQRNKVEWFRIYEKLVGHGCGGKLTVGDFNRDGIDEVFFWVDGQASSSGVIQIKGKSERWLYREGEARFRAWIQDVDKDGYSEVIERWLTKDLEEPYYSQIARQKHVYALKIFKYDRRKGIYHLWRVEPDREFQRKLSREELLRTPGAEEILGLSIR